MQQQPIPALSTGRRRDCRNTAASGSYTRDGAWQLLNLPSKYGAVGAEVADNEPTEPSAPVDLWHVAPERREEATRARFAGGEIDG